MEDGYETVVSCGCGSDLSTYPLVSLPILADDDIGSRCTMPWWPFFFAATLCFTTQRHSRGKDAIR